MTRTRMTRRRKFRAYNNATLNSHAFRSKFEAVSEVMGHLTYTRERYNPSEAPGGIERCRRV